MTDVHDKETRKFNMSQIRGTDTRPEIKVRKFLFSQGFRYRLHSNDLPGKPDIILPRYKTVIFIHGCFWHRHEGCKYSSTPHTNVGFWEQKFASNKERDARVVKEIEEMGWNVVVVWQCQLRNFDDVMNRIMSDLYEKIKH